MKKIIQFMILVFIVILLPKENAAAEENGFSVRPILSAEQIGNDPYFHMKMKQGESKTLSVMLKNNQNTSLTIQINAANGYSNPFGNMNYTNESRTEFSEFLNDKYKLVDLTHMKKKVTLKPNEEKALNIKVNIPSDMNTGQVLGAIQFQTFVHPQKNVDSKEKDKASFAVKVKHRYTIGILIELPNKAKPQLTIKNTAISLNTNIPKIQTEIWNESPVITGEYLFKYTVRKKGSEKVLFQGEKDLFEFAPATTMKMPVDWAYKAFQPGEYQIEISLRDKKSQEVTFQKSNTFSVKKEKVADYAKRTGDSRGIIPKAVFFSNWFYAVFIIVAVLLMYGGYLVGKRNKHTK